MDNLVQIAKIGNRFWPGPVVVAVAVAVAACHLLHSSDHSQTDAKQVQPVVVAIVVVVDRTGMHFSSFAVNRASRSVCVQSAGAARSSYLWLSYDFSCLTRLVYSVCLLCVVDSSNLNVQIC